MVSLASSKAPVSISIRHNFATIAFLDVGAHLRFINLIAPSSEFFFAVTELINCHEIDLVSTVPLYFSLDIGLCCLAGNG
jgi:hypothetical protein